MSCRFVESLNAGLDRKQLQRVFYGNIFKCSTSHIRRIPRQDCNAWVFEVIFHF